MGVRMPCAKVGGGLHCRRSRNQAEDVGATGRSPVGWYGGWTGDLPVAPTVSTASFDLFQRLPERRRRRPRAERNCGQQERAQDGQVRQGGQPGEGGIDGGDAEDEGGDVEREDEERQQGAAAAGAEGEGGTETADQAQARRAQRQRQD